MASWRTEPRRAGGAWWCFRQVSPDWPPLWHSAGEEAPSQESARWHERGAGYAQYLSLSPAGAWAELLRYYGVRSEALAAEQRRHLWLVYVSERDVADLSRFEDWAAAGLDPALPVAEHARSRPLAAELAAAGYRGLLAPSAALPGATNLTLFGERYEWLLQSGLDAFANPDPDLFLPCAQAAGPAPPPAGLTPLVCYRGMPHPGHRRYLAAN